MIERTLSTINKTKNYFTDLVIANFNESLSLFSDLEKNISGQPVVPSPAKNMAPPKNGRQNKIDPAPRDKALFGSVKYTQIKKRAT